MKMYVKWMVRYLRFVLLFFFSLAVAVTVDKYILFSEDLLEILGFLPIEDITD